MRFIHTADWHLGRHFHNVPLLADQEHALEQILDIAKTESIDAIVVAGDIYDRSVPPQDAVRLLSWFVEQAVKGLQIPLILIAGNHDSAERIGFGAEIFAEASLHMIGPLGSEPKRVVLNDNHGPVEFFCIPYADPPVVRERTGDDSLKDHDSAMRALTSMALSKADGSARSVGVAHCFVAGGSESESERPLTVGGAGNVSSAYFKEFDYVALGHLHAPQTAGHDHVRYSGSLLKYSFAEAPHEKSVSLVTLDENGTASAEQVPITPIRDVRIVEGEMNDVLQSADTDDASEDYILVRLQDKTAILDAMGKLREAYPNVLHLERPGLLERKEIATAGVDHRTLGPVDLFAAFFEQVTGEAIADSQQSTLVDVIDSVRVE